MITRLINLTLMYLTRQTHLDQALGLALVFREITAQLMVTEIFGGISTLGSAIQSKLIFQGVIPPQTLLSLVYGISQAHQMATITSRAIYLLEMIFILTIAINTMD